VLVGEKTCPRSLWQSLAWLYAYLPGDERFYTLLLAAICWSIWTIRNKVTFEKYAIKSMILTFLYNQLKG
jgi:hypothetical protein